MLKSNNLFSQDFFAKYRLWEYIKLSWAELIIWKLLLILFESMQSAVYPNILFINNLNLCFIGSQLTQSFNQLVLLHPLDPFVEIYTSLIQKIFSEITILKQMLWICKVSSTSIVRVYFSCSSTSILEPYHYPAGYCCRQPVYVQLQHDLSGSLICSSCKKVISKFVYSMDGHSSNQQIFKKKQRQSKNRKQNMRELLTSQKFRGKNLKDNFFKQPKPIERGGFVMEINERSLPQQQTISTPSVSKDQERLQQLRSIINDIFN